MTKLDFESDPDSDCDSDPSGSNVVTSNSESESRSSSGSESDSDSDCDDTSWGLALAGARPQRGGGGVHPPPPLRTPKLSHGTVCSVGAGAPQILFQAYGGGEFFCSTPCVYTQNTPNFVANSKMGEKHKKVM